MLPANIEQTALSSREDVYNLLKANQHDRFRTQRFDSARDDTRFLLHPMRFEASAHISSADIFQLGLTYYKETEPNSPWHDLTHLKGGKMIDNSAFVCANNLTDGALRLEIFSPNSLTMPNNDHPLRSLREVQLAFLFY